MAKPTTAAKKTKPLSKSAILQAVSEAIGEEISRKHVKSVVETLVTVAHRERRRDGRVRAPGLREVHRREEGGPTCPQGHQPVHEAGADLRGETCEQVGSRPPGEGHQRRSELRSPPAREERGE